MDATHSIHSPRSGPDAVKGRTLRAMKAVGVERKATRPPAPACSRTSSAMVRAVSSVYCSGLGVSRSPSFVE